MSKTLVLDVRRRGRFLTASLALAVSCSLGCGGSGDRPDLGRVSGVVTVDGAPLAGGVVMFDPEGLRSSRGFTDDQGRYELTYLRDVKGAAVGSHRVYINVVPDADGPVKTLPKKYNTNTELSAEVASGKNTFDWELESAQ